ncbi:MAG: VOC family protein [Betaproteobacteria bacterium]|nr:VOC family protein [Betaproteobacteria bacterium]
MRAHLRGIDHAVIAVRDLEAARDTYARLGFTLTPRGRHTLGSQNHCIMFERDYLELLALPKVHPSMRYYADFLARGEGLAALALAGDDAQAAQAELLAAGIAAEAPLDFSRPVELPEGARDASFRIVQLPAEQTPGCRAFVCQHFTPELVWRAEHQAHAVGAIAIAALAVVAEDPLVCAGRYGLVFGEAPRRIDEGWLVASGSAPVALCTRSSLGHRLEGVGLPARTRPLVAALFVRVADRGRARRALARGGFGVVELRDGSLAVSAEQTHGVALVFG